MKAEHKNPKLTVVGAGPGDPDLLTLKGANALASADVVLYDALVNIALLNLVRPHVPKIFVGKRKANHQYAQQHINELIVQEAKQYGHVVRLKGGDPFVFGRGQEEIEFAKAHGLETAYIPGISSAISVPGLAGIPVTHRGISESFWVITGTTSAGEISSDIATAAHSNATVVILMGLSQLGNIVDIFLQANRHELPVAVIQSGSLPEEKVVVGTVETIIQNVEAAQLTHPAIIVLGEVVRLHPQITHEIRNKYAH